MRLATYQILELSDPRIPLSVTENEGAYRVYIIYHVKGGSVLPELYPQHRWETLLLDQPLQPIQ